MTDPLTLRYDAKRGLLLSCQLSPEVALFEQPVRVELRGTHVFYVWGAFGGDSGEEAPAWAEADLHCVFFGPEEVGSGTSCLLEKSSGADGASGWRAVGRNSRSQVVLEARWEQGELALTLQVENPPGPQALPLPVGQVELRVEDLDLGASGSFLSAHAYGGRTHGYGKLVELEESGVHFAHGCIGLNLPLLYLHDETQQRGVQIEFMLDDRPLCQLRTGSSRPKANWSLSWGPERLLEVGQCHRLGGAARLSGFIGKPVARLRQWRDAAGERYGLVSPATPTWARDANIIEFWTIPDYYDFTRLDDVRCLKMLGYWKSLGYTAIFAVGHNHTGKHALSPIDYEPCEKSGGVAAEQQMLAWAHDLGFHIFLWITTVGIDKDAALVNEHPDWFTQRRDGSLFYAWDSGPKTNYIGYAPDGDPLASGWRRWLEDQAGQLVARGFDGVYVDGCIPRASNHARWHWPGQGRNGVESQVRQLAEHLRQVSSAMGKPGQIITFVEDESLSTQVHAEVTQGRYAAITPYFPKAFWDLGMGGGPQVTTAPPQQIPPEMARDYLLVRYGSLLPGVVSNDVLEGYVSEAARPWTMQGMLCGVTPKTHSPWINEPEKYRKVSEIDDPPAEQQAATHRLRGHQEWVAMLQFCRDEKMIHRAALSIEGVKVEGDDAVVGILRPTDGRAILAVIQFAPRAAQVRVSLAAPTDVPRAQRAEVGKPHEQRWRVREVMRSMVEDQPTPAALLGPGSSPSLRVELGPYSFRVFELTRA